MTVQELIDELQKIEDKALPVIIKEGYNCEFCDDVTNFEVISGRATALDCGLKAYGEHGQFDSVPCVRIIP